MVWCSQILKKSSTLKWQWLHIGLSLKLRSTAQLPSPASATALKSLGRTWLPSHLALSRVPKGTKESPHISAVDLQQNPEPSFSSVAKCSPSHSRCFSILPSHMWSRLPASLVWMMLPCPLFSPFYFFLYLLSVLGSSLLHRLSLVVESGGYPLLWCSSSLMLWLLSWDTDSRCSCFSIHSPPETPLPSRLPHSTEQSFMCHTVGPCWLSF